MDMGLEIIYGLAAFVLLTALIFAVVHIISATGGQSRPATRLSARDSSGMRHDTALS
ncbi:purine-cytosine permease-like protein [Bradyrhizobium sp. USDA 4011]